MKKISILLIAVIGMISCSNTYEAKTVRLDNENDSINYALGVVNGAQIKMYYMNNDSTDAAVQEFMQGLTDGYEGKVVEKSKAEQTGENIGSFVRQCENEGLAQNKNWPINEKLFFQGLVNGMLKDTSVMSSDFAREWFQGKYYAQMNKEETEAENIGKAIKSKCMDKAQAVELKSELDSLNYAFGYINGEGIGNDLLRNDSTGGDFQKLVKAINSSLRSSMHNPQLVQMAQQIGKTIREQEADGLLGIAELPTEFELIAQGFTNGLYGFEEQMNMQEAGDYVNAAIERIKYGPVKAEGAAFLEENAKREEVVVTESGLQYEVLKMGKGKKPTATDRVKVHYHGTLIDGTVFDSSVERGEPITFALNQVIKGWTEGVQLMPVGSKFRFYIPQELGYGSQQAGDIPPFSTLIFDVELLGIE